MMSGSLEDAASYRPVVKPDLYAQVRSGKRAPQALKGRKELHKNKSWQGR
jgi:hypothetical protein